MSLLLVDETLALLRLLSQRSSVRVTDIAVELGISPSKAHRMLATLTQRGFAARTADRRYQVGPALQEFARSVTGPTLAEVAGTYMRALARQTGETVNLSVRDGAFVTFVESVEGKSALRVGDRLGLTLPAERASGGRILLAALDSSAIRELYAASSSRADAEIETIVRDAALARRRGYAINDGETEKGIVAIGVPVRDRGGRPVAALSIAAPTVRYRGRRLVELLDPLKATANQIRQVYATGTAIRPDGPQAALRLDGC